MWDLKYVLDLQRATMPREGYADSITDASFEYLPLFGVLYLASPSPSFLPIEEEEASIEGHNGSEPTAK